MVTNIILVVVLVAVLFGAAYAIIKLEDIIINKFSPWDAIVLAEEIEIEGEDVGVYSVREDEPTIP